MLVLDKKPRFSSSLTSPNNSVNINVEGLNPFFVTGFCDAESCFFLSFFKDKGRKTG
jgi:hypothetical protein